MEIQTDSRFGKAERAEGEAENDVFGDRDPRVD